MRTSPGEPWSFGAEILSFCYQASLTSLTMSAVSSTFRAHYCMHSEKSAISLSLKVLPFPTVGSLVIRSGQDTRSDPCISSVTTLIMIATSNSSREGGAGCPINSSMFYSTPRTVPSWPACEPNFFTCS